MNKKRLIILWIILGIALIIFELLPYRFKEGLLFLFIGWLIMFLISKIEEKSNKIKELEEFIFYLEDKLGIFNKMESDEGEPYYKLKWILKDRDKRR